MNPEPDQINPSKEHELFYNPEDPNTLVMLKKIELMSYFHQLQVHPDETGNQVFKHFPNYFILNNLKVAHRQKAILYSMLKHKTDPEIMIRQFCRLAKQCYPSSDDHEDIRQLQDLLAKRQISASELLRQYTKETFFYRLLNRLLRAGKDSTEVYYGQHFVKLLSQAVRAVYQKQKNENLLQVSGSFKCFRAAYFSQKQIKELQQNIGKHIETLGFLSTSAEKQIAQGFLQNGNTLVEINVDSDVRKDQQVDLGYAFLTKEYSNSPIEREVLFNVLSSFQIRDVSKINHQGRQIWHIRMQYGVTYQMMRKYRQNKLCTKRGSPQQQQILAILLHQDFIEYTFDIQDQCLLQQFAIREYMWMKQTKISLCESTPSFQFFGRQQQIKLYYKLLLDQKFQGKYKNMITRIQPKLQSYKKQVLDNKQPTITIWKNLIDALQIIGRYFIKGNYCQARQQAQRWKQHKKQAQQNPDYILEIRCHAQSKILMKQLSDLVEAVEILSHMEICFTKGNKLQLKRVLKRLKLLMQQRLKYNGRYDKMYALLSQKWTYHSYNLGLVSYQEYLSQRQNGIIRKKGEDINQETILQAELIQTWKQSNRLIQKKSWAQAVQVCAQFRDKYYTGRGQEDAKCFGSILVHLIKQQTSLIEKLQIFNTCFKISHPPNSEFCEKAKLAWMHDKQKQSNIIKIFIRQIKQNLTQPAQLIGELLYLKQKQILSLTFGKDSIVQTTLQCLVVNALRMLGKYEQADRCFHQLKLKIRASGHSEFVDLSLFEF